MARIREIVPGYVVEIDAFLSPAECMALVAEAEQAGFGPAGAVGAGDAPSCRAWTLTQERPRLASMLWNSLKPLMPPHPSSAWLPIGLDERLRFLRYGSGQDRALHAAVPVSRGQALGRMSLHVHLNGGFRGGLTCLRRLRFRPRTGSAVLFMHDLEHGSTRVVSGSKYVMCADVLYVRAAAEMPQRSDLDPRVAAARAADTG